MDIVTQGLLGAGLAQTAAGRDLRLATVVGFAAGLLPDADALVRSDADPLLFLDFHRHFTHALVFVPVGAALASLVLWPFVRRRLTVSRLYLYAFLGCALAGALDACTSYGTYLFWPFLDEPVAWRIIAIFDPVFSLILLLGVGIGVATRRNSAARISLLLAGAYLGLGVWQHHRAEHIARALAAERGHSIERLLVKPTLGNLVLWRSLYVADGQLFADGVRCGLTGGERVYPGESRPLLQPGSLPPDAGFKLGDIERFTRFADGLLVRHPTRPGMIGDARFAMLPTRLRPLWGIEPVATGAVPGTRFVTDRSMSEDERGRFVDMLLGRPVVQP